MESPTSDDFWDSAPWLRSFHTNQILLSHSSPPKISQHQKPTEKPDENSIHLLQNHSNAHYSSLINSRCLCDWRSNWLYNRWVYFESSRWRLQRLRQFGKFLWICRMDSITKNLGGRLGSRHHFFWRNLDFFWGLPFGQPEFMFHKCF